MKKAIVLSNIDDFCTEIYADSVLGIKSHKMVLKVEGDVEDRSIYNRIRSMHKAMYEAAVAKESRVHFLLCDYLPHHELYKQVMLVSKCYIKKGTVMMSVVIIFLCPKSSS